MTADCQIWDGPVDRGGYGRAGRSGPAHRLAYECVHGPIPPGMTVDHLCFNPPCVNPEHLRLLTMRENSRNQRSARKPSCINGHEYTDENTYLRTTRAGGRRDCRACIRARVARYRASRRAAA